MISMETPAKIFSCTQSTELANAIAAKYGAEIGKVNFSRYSDGEFQPSFEESVRGARVFLIGSTNPSSENLMELLLSPQALVAELVDALDSKSSSFGSVGSIPTQGTFF